MFATLALVLPAVVNAAPAKPTPTAKRAPAAKRDSVKKGTTASRSNPAPLPDPVPSDAARRVIDWVSSSADNRGLPWAVVDKTGAALFLFDADGQQLAAVPVLVGIAPGDDASPGVGNKKLAELGPAEKTTPAGRFLARYSVPYRGERILWVDYADSVGMHPIPKDVGPNEHRRERMLSQTPEDHRITFGCINVPKAFYGSKLRPMFQRHGGYVYVLPDTRPLEEVFPRIRIAANTG